MMSSPAGKPDEATESPGTDPIPPLPHGAAMAEARHCRSMTAGLPALIKGVRDRRVSYDDYETYARLVHALRNTNSADAYRIGAAAILLLARRAA